MSRFMTKPTKWLCAHQRLRSAWASAQPDQSWQCAQWVAKDPCFLHVDSKDSDQTGWMPRLIWVFAGRTCHFVGFVMRLLKFCQTFCIIFFLSCENNLHTKIEPAHHRRPAKDQASLHIRAVSPEPSLFAHVKYGCRRRVWPKIRYLAHWIAAHARLKN